MQLKCLIMSDSNARVYDHSLLVTVTIQNSFQTMYRNCYNLSRRFYLLEYVLPFLSPFRSLYGCFYVNNIF